MEALRWGQLMMKIIGPGETQPAFRRLQSIADNGGLHERGHLPPARGILPGTCRSCDLEPGAAGWLKLAADWDLLAEEVDQRDCAAVEHLRANVGPYDLASRPLPILVAVTR